MWEARVHKTMHTQCDNIQQYTHKWYINYCVGISMLAVCCSEGHLLVLISPARVESSILRKASTRVAQFTGCLPLPVSHSWRISVFICTGLFKHLCAIILTLDPFLSSRRKVLKRTYLVAISTGMLTTLPSVHVNFNSSGRVGLVPGVYVVCGELGKMCAIYQTPYLTAVQRNDTLGSHYVGDPPDWARKSDRRQTQRLLYASKSLQGSHSTTTKNAIYTTKRTKVRTAQKYNNRQRKVHTKMRPNTEPNKDIH